MRMEQEVSRFKMELLRKMPFYGDILMRLPIVENSKIPTARTDGGKIEYNGKFFSGMERGERNFVLMHEVLHVILLHCKRQKRDPMLWNTAQDIVVNNMLMKLMSSMQNAGIPFKRPPNGIFAYTYAGETADNIYEKLLIENQNRSKNSKKVYVRVSPWKKEPEEFDAPDDLVIPLEGGDDFDGIAVVHDLTGGGVAGLDEQAILRIIREAASKNRGTMGSYFVPDQIYRLTESKRIKWKTLLRNFLAEELSDEASYATPERKYLHMDLILPGHGLDNERIEELWAFVDCSGSVGKNETEQFLTQLYRITKEFKCVLNLCYWDTEVNDIYKKIRREEDVLKSLPHHSGGTDINCIYRWIKANRVKPDVMLILTDGYFGTLDQSVFVPSLGKKTILVLSGSVIVTDEMKRIGKITRLE